MGLNCNKLLFHNEHQPYGYLIPIPLYISIEIVKVLQPILINSDIVMYDEEACKSTEARNSNLNEDLGHVEIILSDKTGTLTCNQMELRKCSVAGISYGEEVNEIDIAAAKRINVDVTKYKDAFHGVNTKETSERKNENFISHLGKSHPFLSEHAIKGFNFKDDRLMNMIWIKELQVLDIALFLRVMVLCHTSIPVEQDMMGKFRYEAESPEEVSFLVAAQELGFTFYRRTQSIIVLKEPNLSSGREIERQYRLLNLLEFSSSCKWMSVDRSFFYLPGRTSKLHGNVSQAKAATLPHGRSTKSHFYNLTKPSVQALRAP